MVRPDVERPDRLRNDNIRWPTRIGMKLPNRERAILPRERIRDYLLSDSHPDGRHKAAFFDSGVNAIQLCAVSESLRSAG